MNTLNADPFDTGMNTLNADPFSTGMGTSNDPFGTGMNTLNDPFGAGMNTLHDPFGLGMDNTLDALFGEMHDAQIGGSFNDTAMDLFTQDTHAPFDQAMPDLTSQDFISGQWTAPLTDTTVGAYDHLPAATNGDNPHGIWAWDPFQTLLTPHPPEPTPSTSAVPANTTGEHQHDSHAQHDSDGDYGDLFSDEGADTPAGSQSTPLITSGEPLPRLTLPTAGPSTRPTRAPRVSNEAPRQDNTAAPSTSGPTRTSRQKQRQKPYPNKGRKRHYYTVDERVAAITTWVQKDPTNRRNTIPPRGDSVNVGGKAYPVGNFLSDLTLVWVISVDDKLTQALEDAGFKVKNDGRGHMHIVGFRRMSDENVRDFLAVYDIWLSEEDANGNLHNIGKMPKSTLERPNPNKPGEQFQLGKFMHNLKSNGHADPDGEMAEMLKEKGRLEVIYLNEGDTSRFDGLRVPGRPPRKPRPPTAKQEEDNQERIAGIQLWVGPDRENSGKIPAKTEEVKDAEENVHPVGKTFHILRQMGFLFHQELFDVLNDNGFQPKVIGSKILIPRDKGMLVTVAEKADRDEDTFAAYDLWCEGDSTRAGKIPAYDTLVPLPETGKVIDLGVRMRNLIDVGRVGPQKMIAQALSARGLQTESRDGKTFLVRPKEAAGGESQSVSATTQTTAKPAVLGRPEGAAGGELRSVSAATQKVANLAVGRRPLPWEGASGSGVAVVRESVILPPG
ncbi:hypothetical protein ACLQ24_29365, partial [Micromonospora sp. DT4]|uniref:hypothetical protein n=1 Tax=Micromonospora sp. DT4 TaxID=3393438 RepID=UPI003CE7974C